MEKMYFYHSFPRGDNIKLQSEKGLKILESMVKFGFLLKPEDPPLDWAKYIGFDKLGKKLIMRQKRICFTFIRPNELMDHKKKWGIFSIEFDKELLNIGAMPMFYVPVTHKPDASVSHILVQRLWNIILDKELKNKPEIKETVRSIFGLLYPTEYSLKDPKFNNYHLREWRITGNTANLLAWIYDFSCQLEPEEKEQLKGFFSNDELDEILKIREIGGRHVLSYARRIIVPDVVEDRAEYIIKNKLGEDGPEVISIRKFLDEI